MPRLIISSGFSSQQTLLGNIVLQNTATGAASPLTAFLAQQQIVLQNDVAAGNLAQTHETSRALLAKQSENHRQLRDNHFKQPWRHLKGSVQFLKSFYKGNARQLGNWGITITATGKVKYPPAFAGRTAVFKTFIETHNTYAPGTSPLQPYFAQQNISPAIDAAFAQQAMDAHTAYAAAAQQSENETELRNQIWLPVLGNIKAIGNFLMKLYSNNPKALGNWGFMVDESSKKHRLRTTRLKPGEQKSIMSVVLGSVLINAGTVAMHLYKGKTTTGTPVIIPAGGQLGIQKGFSTISVVNPSTQETVVFKVTVNV